MKILVVDDESAALSNFLAEIMDEPDLDYKMLRNPEDALDYAKKNKIDAAFLDINMPQMNGVDLAEKLVALNPSIDIIFISGYANNESEITDRLGKNLKGFCRKPYDTNTLYRFIHGLSDRAATLKVNVKTFGLFDISYHGKSIRFSSTKSKELLAFLIEKEGAYVPMDIAMTALWPEKSAHLAKKLYRDAVIRLKLTLKEHGLEALVYFFRAELSLNRVLVNCDLWQAKDNNDFTKYNFEYMTQYAEWSSERQFALDILKDK